MLRSPRERRAHSRGLAQRIVRSAAGVQRPAVVRKGTPGTGEARYSNSTRHLILSWIPCSKKNRTRACVVGNKMRWIPDRKVVQETNIIRAIALSTPGPPCDSESEFSIRIVIVRRTPSEAKTGKRNTRRGDPVNMPGLICDALEGLWWANDEQITKVEIDESRCGKADQFDIYAWRRHDHQ